MDVSEQLRAEVEPSWPAIWGEMRKASQWMDDLPEEQQAEIERQSKEQMLVATAKINQVCADTHRAACEHCATLVEEFIDAQAKVLTGTAVLKLQTLVRLMRELGQAWEVRA